MLPAILFVALLHGAAAGSSDNEFGANPIRKIVTLLQDMQKEIEAEGTKEKELYEKFMCFCSGGKEELEKTSADSAQAIETLTSQAEEQTAEKTGLEGDLKKHEEERTSATADLAKATAIRGKENADYETSLADQKSNFQAISGAIPALEKGMGGAASLLQQNGNDLKKKLQRALGASQVVSSGERKDVMAFLEQSGDYAPASGQIVGILKNMKDEMEKSITSLTKDEEDAVAGYGDLKAAKEQEVEVASEAIEAKTKRVGELAVSIVQAEDGADDATKEKANADKFLATLDTQCVTKQQEWDARCKMRNDEVAAISQAVGILNDDDALDVFKKAVPAALMQRSSTHAARKFGFLQAAKAAASPLSRALSFISASVQLHRNLQLEVLANTMKTKLRYQEKARLHGKTDLNGAVDFTAITKMIEDMIVVLGKQQAADSKHKVWCEGELEKNADEAKQASETVASLGASIAETTDEISTAADDIAALQEGIKALDKDVASATEMRKAEHADYLETVQLTEASIQLLGKAKNRLQKFYNPALHKPEETAEEEALMQAGNFAQLASHVAPPEAPETFGAYEKKGQKSGGVMALMDMLTRELESTLQEAQHDEKSAQGEYVELMTDSQKQRQQDSEAVTDKSAAKAALEATLVSLKENKAATLKQMEDINAYNTEVHGSCDFILQNFKLREEARTNEIEGLKNAKAVLAGASYS
jgi:hypothetical protein